MESLDYFICPEGHGIQMRRENYAKDDSDKLLDADGLPMYESGLYCSGCDRAYGLSKLKELNFCGF